MIIPDRKATIVDCLSRPAGALAQGKAPPMTSPKFQPLLIFQLPDPPLTYTLYM